MSRTTTNVGLTAVTNSETIGDFSDAMNASGGNLDIIDGKLGPVGNTSLQAQINALNSNIEEFIPTKRIRTSTVSSFSINFPSGGQFIVTSTLNGMNYNCILLINVYNNGTIYIAEIYKGSSVAITAQTNKITISTGYSGVYSVNVLAMSYGSAVSDITIS